MLDKTLVQFLVLSDQSNRLQKKVRPLGQL